jgi:hypothetical protein
MALGSFSRLRRSRINTLPFRVPINTMAPSAEKVRAVKGSSVVKVLNSLSTEVQRMFPRSSEMMYARSLFLQINHPYLAR